MGGQAGGSGGLWGWRGGTWQRNPRGGKDGACGPMAWAGGVRGQLRIWPSGWGSVTGLQSIGCHCKVTIPGGPETLGGFSPEEGTFELSLEDVRISQDEKGWQCFPGREKSTCKGLETAHHLVCLQTFSIGGHRASLRGKSLRMGSNQRWQGQNTRAEGLGPWVVALGGEGRVPSTLEFSESWRRDSIWGLGLVSRKGTFFIFCHQGPLQIPKCPLPPSLAGTS